PRVGYSVVRAAVCLLARAARPLPPARAGATAPARPPGGGRPMRSSALLAHEVDGASPRLRPESPSTASRPGPGPPQQSEVPFSALPLLGTVGRAACGPRRGFAPPPREGAAAVPRTQPSPHPAPQRGERALVVSADERLRDD